MRHPSCLGLFVLLLASGCERMQDESVFVYGRLERRDGTPVSGGVLPYARTKHEVPMGEGPYVFAPPDFRDYAEASTEASGDFFLEMRYGDVESVNTPNAWLQPYRFRASWRDEAARPSSRPSPSTTTWNFPRCASGTPSSPSRLTRRARP